MTGERKEQIKTISDQFNEEISKLAYKTEEEIQQMVNDSVTAFETMYKRKPDLLNHMMFYDDLTIRLIQNIFVIREVRR